MIRTSYLVAALTCAALNLFASVSIAQPASSPSIDAEVASQFWRAVEEWRQASQASQAKRTIELAEKALDLEGKIKFWTANESRPQLRGQLLTSLARAFLDLSDENGPENLERAIVALESSLEVLTREGSPWDWAAAHNELAIAYATRTQGDRALNIDRSIVEFEAALSVFTRDAYPRNWAQTQHNLGSALEARLNGDRTDNLERAIVAYEAALGVRTRQELPEEWATTQYFLSSVYLERKQGDRNYNLDRAIEGLEGVLGVNTREAAPDEWANAQNLLGLALLADFRDRSEKLERAIAAFEAALTVRLRETSPRDWASSQTSLGHALAERVQGPPSENIDRAVSAFEAALSVWSVTDSPREWADVKSSLALAYLHQRGRGAESTERALDALQASLAVYTRVAFPREWARTHYNLALAFFNRVRGDRTDNIERAISHLESSLLVYTRSASPRDWAQAQQALGEFFRLRILGDASDNRERAVSAYEAALSVLTRNDSPRDWAEAQNGLAIALADRVFGSKSDNLDRAIVAFESAGTVLTAEAAPQSWVVLKNNLAMVYRSRMRGERAENIDRAIESLEAALTADIKQSHPREWALAQSNLGETLLWRLRGERSKNRERAVAALEAALSVRTLDAYPRNHLQTGTALGEVLIENGDWSGAKAILTSAREAFRILFAQGFNEIDSRDLIATAGRLFSNLAYVTAQLGDPEQALELLDEGKGRLIAVSLRLHALDLPPDSGRRMEALRSEIREISRILEGSAAVERGGLLEKLIATRGELLSLVQEAEAATAPTEGAAVIAGAIAGQGGAVIAPVVTKVGSKFLIAGSAAAPARVIALDVPDLTAERLDLLIRGDRRDGPAAGWLGAYGINYIEDEVERDARWSEWMAAIDNIGPTLWGIVGSRLHAALTAGGIKSGATLYFLPSGGLGILPLGLAVDVTRMRRLFDDFEIVYAPSLRTLAAARSRVAKAEPSSLLAVINPTGDLPGTVKEGTIVAAHFPAHARALLQSEAATPEAVLAALKGKTHWHFASHGAFSWDDARQSGLVMHGNARLTVGKLLESDGLGRPRLVVLSACETGLYDIERSADEFVGLPGAFMGLGAAGVIGSLWPVADDATALLMTKFYDLHMIEGLAPSRALARAQMWLREATTSEISAYARSAAVVGRLERGHLAEIEKALSATPAVAHRNRAAARQSARTTAAAAQDLGRSTAGAPELARPYSHPYFWAGFVHTGL